ncbi:MAG: rod shape-determining protein MreC [Bacteroidetes bacterium GWF2_43_63]|nr:MAG: rod shape-determining protein MreC [Bacteroidetes bacterium GWE2_42_42]OFY56317.1 MAG: rod shape-determining protein MreC [Bacteroidetes bacterium GWF2_43_63]HBG71997.1 rod shape-determining protein MreC [Bacteroidales bacterium]HCB61898.1 rod shape-determining protein MreC [Bacteroidales bacterium]HCY23920.1 rod shape-determining protein MreC [Bacteroidales bacterium]
MRNLLDFIKSIRILLLFLFLETLALLFTFNQSSFHGATSFQFFMGINSRIMSVRSDVVSFFNLREENRRLIEENMSLRQHLKDSYIISDQRVFTVNDSLYRQEFEFLTASVINYTISYQDNFITLDKGYEQGIEEGMGVYSPAGVVGIVDHVSKNYCLVKSVLHSEVTVSTTIKNKNVTGTCTWDGANYAYGILKDIPVHVKLKQGDTLLTSNYSSIFPAGIPVGYVTEFSTDATRAFYNVRYRIAADFGNLSSVYIIRNLIKGELDELEKLKEEKHEQ